MKKLALFLTLVMSMVLVLVSTGTALADKGGGKSEGRGRTVERLDINASGTPFGQYSPYELKLFPDPNYGPFARVKSIGSGSIGGTIGEEGFTAGVEVDVRCMLKMSPSDLGLKESGTCNGDIDITGSSLNLHGKVVGKVTIYLWVDSTTGEVISVLGGEVDLICTIKSGTYNGANVVSGLLKVKGAWGVANLENPYSAPSITGSILVRSWS